MAPRSKLDVGQRVFCLGADLGTSNTKFWARIGTGDNYINGYFSSRYAPVNNSVQQELPSYEDALYFDRTWHVFGDAAEKYGEPDALELGHKQQYTQDTYRNLLSYTMFRAFGQWSEVNQAYTYLNPDVHLSLSVPVALYADAAWLDNFTKYISGEHTVTNGYDAVQRFNVLTAPDYATGLGVSKYKNSKLKVMPDGMGAFVSYMKKGGERAGTTIVLNIGMQTYDITMYVDGFHEPRTWFTNDDGGFHLSDSMKGLFPMYSSFSVHALDKIIRNRASITDPHIKQNIQRQIELLAKRQARNLAVFLQTNKITPSRILVFGGYGDICYDALKSNARTIGVLPGIIRKIGDAPTDMYYGNAEGSLLAAIDSASKAG